MSLNKVPVVARFPMKRLLALHAPMTDDFPRVVFWTVVIFQLQNSIKLQVADVALELHQVSVLVVVQVAEHAAADVILLPATLATVGVLQLQRQNKKWTLYVLNEEHKISEILLKVPPVIEARASPRIVYALITAKTQAKIYVVQ